MIHFAGFKLAVVVVGEFVLLTAIIAQTTAIPTGSQDLTIAGLATAALGLLAYTVRLVVNGDLISKKSVQETAEYATRETLRQLGK